MSLTRMIPLSEKLSEFKETIREVHNAIWGRNSPLLILKDDESISDILFELDTQLQESGLFDSHSRQKKLSLCRNS